MSQAKRARPGGPDHDELGDVLIDLHNLQNAAAASNTAALVTVQSGLITATDRLVSAEAEIEDLHQHHDGVSQNLADLEATVVSLEAQVGTALAVFTALEARILELHPPGPGVHSLTIGSHPYNPALNGTYTSVGSFYRDPSPPRNFRESADHHVFRRDTADKTYLVFSYGIHTNATWYVSTNPLLAADLDLQGKNSTDIGQTAQASIGLTWNDYSIIDPSAYGHWPSAAYSPSHTIVGSYSPPTGSAPPPPVVPDHSEMVPNLNDLWTFANLAQNWIGTGGNLLYYDYVLTFPAENDGIQQQRHDALHRILVAIAANPSASEAAIVASLPTANDM